MIDIRLFLFISFLMILLSIQTISFSLAAFLIGNG